MKNIFFAILFTLLFSGLALAQEDSASDKTHSVYILGTVGAMIPSEMYDVTFSGGGTLGFQITKYLAMEASAVYLNWAHDGKSPLLRSYNANADTVDFKVYVMYQQDFNITNKLSLIPSIGVAPVYSYHKSGSPFNSFGIAGKLGFRVAYSYFIAGVNVEYTIKNLYRNAVSVMFEVGVRLNF